jgi:hypothetical protein
MREEVGRSIGLSARKVQVRFELHISPPVSTDFRNVHRAILSFTFQVWFQASIGSAYFGEHKEQLT